MSINTMHDFLITEWLWSITWGVYHVPFLLAFMLILLKRVAGMRWLPNLMNSIGSVIFSLFIYGFVIAWLIPDAHFDYATVQETLVVPSAWWASVYLGLIYAVLQTIFFMLVSLAYTTNRPRVLVIVALSNFLAAIAAYLLAPIS